MLGQLSVSLDTGSIQMGALSENTQKKSSQLENQSMQTSDHVVRKGLVTITTGPVLTRLKTLALAFKYLPSLCKVPDSTCSTAKSK